MNTLELNERRVYKKVNASEGKTITNATTRAPQVCGPPQLFLIFSATRPIFPPTLSFGPESRLLAVWLNVCVIKSVQQWLNYSYN